MSRTLQVTIGQGSDAGIKPVNQDFHGAYTPKEPLLSTKGIAIALADGISSSDVSQVASETAVKSFLEDYFSTSQAWSVKTSALKVLSATNSWLFAQTRCSPDRFNKDKGYVCTFSALIFKSSQAHIFHTGDSRIYRQAGQRLEQLTTDHRRQAPEGQHYLTRALGIHETLDLDYHSLTIETGDTFLLMTDGVYEFVSDKSILQAIAQNKEDLNAAAEDILNVAREAGSDDNLTIQIARIENLPTPHIEEVQQQIDELPFPPQLQTRMQFDGYDIIRDIYISSRSHVHLAIDQTSQEKVVIKAPSAEMRENKAYLESFMMEDWIAQRVNHAHVLKAIPVARRKNYLYTVTEFIDGCSLRQWMLDHPKPTLDQVRNIIEQTALGLQAFHRQEMVHQDLRPNNIMIDATGTVKIIDFGATKVAGISEIAHSNEGLVGTVQFSAPEYFITQSGDHRSDIYSLGVIAYQMLCGDLPYGTSVAKLRKPSDLRKLQYRSLQERNNIVPTWVDDAIKKAVHPHNIKRYQDVSEFVYDLHHPNKTFIAKTKPPLIERDPILFWQTIALLLLMVVIGQGVCVY
ncbi:bifunctional protein-serine/threonine kinase/phosphatase [Litoribacillus peritrichatus]|uniref:Bifunctional protein-serine/threonine kinase/phosphatase n=1 Tax=Litoribacillus peritrichatus TaxID=718191 RepID=A0ABP7MJY2_9GAMM